MTELWEIEKAMQSDTNALRNQIWAASNGQPVPGSISVEACRFVLALRGEEPIGFHDT